MDIKDFISALKGKENELRTLVDRNLPVMAGRLAVDHFRDNFRQGGFVDSSLQKWTPAKRLLSGGNDAASQYGSLLSGRNRLFDSIRSVPAPGRAIIRTSVPYARIHNEGGTIQSTVTPRMRAYAWHRFYKEAGIRKDHSGKKRNKQYASAQDSLKAMFWKRLALTRKPRLSIKIPKRQFIGPSRALDMRIQAMVESELRKLLNL